MSLFISTSGSLNNFVKYGLSSNVNEPSFSGIWVSVLVLIYILKATTTKEDNKFIIFKFIFYVKIERPLDKEWKINSIIN